MVMNCLTLQLRRYSTSKGLWLPTSWINDVRSHKTWVLNTIAVITRNVASTHYCILQVLVAALLLVSSTAIVKSYPDPLDCHKYYLRTDDIFYNLTCPNNLVFDQYLGQCAQNNNCMPPYIMPLCVSDCNQNQEGYYCTSNTTFTYCTHDGLKIMNNAPCPDGLFCRGPKKSNPCVP
jgi:hypothetical protein